MTNRLWIGLTAFLFILAPPQAFADESPCSNLTSAEVDAYNGHLGVAAAAKAESDWKTAIESLIAAREVCDEDPKFALRLGQWHLELEDCENAGFWFDLVKDMRPDGRFDGLIRSARENAAIERMKMKEICVAKTGTVALRCADEGVEVQVGAKTVSCPGEVELDPGDVTIVASAPGRESHTTTASVRAGSSLQIEIPSLKSTVVEVVDPKKGETKDPLEPVPPVDEGIGGTGIAGWVLLGTGVAALGAGGALHGLAFAELSSAEDVAKPAAGTTEAERRLAYQDAVDAMEVDELVAYTLYGVGGAMVVTGVILVVLDSGSSETAADQGAALEPDAVAPAILDDGVALSAMWRF